MFIFLASMIVFSVVSYGYIRNSDIALLSAKQLIRQTGSSIGEKTQRIFDTAFMTANTYVSFPEIGEKASLHSHPMSNVFFKFLQENPDFTSVYMGFSDGDFFLISSLRGREAMKKQKHIPDYALWYTQTIGHLPDGTRYELTKYLDKGLCIIGSQSSINVKYDPRNRSWFKNAETTDVAVLSDVYVFALAEEPGLTVSKRFDSEVSGVLGVDLSLANISNFMKKEQVGKECEIIIFENSGELYGYQDLEKLTSSIYWNSDKTIKTVTVSGLKKNVLNSLVRSTKENNINDFQTQHLVVDDVSYISLIDPLPTEYGKKLFLAIAVPERFFTGPIAIIGKQTLLVSLGILIIFLPIIFIAAKRLSLPLKILTEEVKKIQDFKLETPIMIKSNIIEIRDLSNATETMRETLNAFGSYIPRPLVESMIVNKITPKLGGRRQRLTIMFTDIQDFTSISENMSPEKLMRSITSYLKTMGQAVLNNDGTIDKYIGDSIMAFWNAPVANTLHAQLSCLAALQCRDLLKKFNSECKNNNEPVLLTRFGIHTGDAIVGNIGSSDRMDYTAIGASVNIASRLEGLNKFFGTEILVSETTMKETGDIFQFRFAGKVVPKGTSVALGVYELLGTRCDSSKEFEPYAVAPLVVTQVNEWEFAFAALLRGEFYKSASALSSYIEKYGPDSLVNYYLTLAQKYVSNPPDESWLGEIVFDAK
ncbi:adenylate/guanylate cyclase domain-containing protein [Maridesulfovibrio zosterae]|uniref:adenylate/guanylate cyclase domain-containing protein n=1 Tax=Maridesulfovibrio zosterae TaxID=82171 RepID=UPI00040F7D7A|nr:adenylate/guanylate cyclase domain-containing protein [Maridesulfovibrio zosterae]